MKLLFLSWMLAGLGLMHSLPYLIDGKTGNIPLKSLHVSGVFYDSLGEVVIRQVWSNNAPKAITSNYKFSLDANAVISGYKMKIGNRLFSGVVKAKDTARKEFTEAVAAGNKSSLLVKFSDTDYQVEIGPISSNEVVEVEFRYLTRAPVMSDGSFRYTLPTNIAPKYTSIVHGNQADLDYAKNMSLTYMSQPPYTFDVDITWHSGSQLREIVSPTNTITTQVISNTNIRVLCKTAPENGDFTLLVRNAATHGSYIYEKEDGTSILYIHSQIPPEVVSETAKKITILIDRSGSMETANKINNAIKAVDQFLTLIPSKYIVNIVSFGSRYEAMFSHSIPATASNIAKIRANLKDFTADYGGTELLQCLTAVIDGKFPSSSSVDPSGVKTTEHVVVLMTDGQVGNLNSILSMLDKTKTTRFFTLGIGHDAQRNLITQVADKTNGLSRMLVDELSLTTALTDIMSHINKQYYTDMKILNFESTQSSKVLYPSNPVDIFLRLEKHEFQRIQKNGVTITALDPIHNNQAKEWSITMNNNVKVNNLLEKLYVHHIIQENIKKYDALEEMTSTMTDTDRRTTRTNLDTEIVRLSVEYGLMNTRTSFLIISDEKISEKEKKKGVQAVDVPHHESVHAVRGFKSFRAMGAGHSMGAGHAPKSQNVGNVKYSAMTISPPANQVSSLQKDVSSVLPPPTVTSFNDDTDVTVLDQVKGLQSNRHTVRTGTTTNVDSNSNLNSNDMDTIVHICYGIGLITVLGVLYVGYKRFRGKRTM